MHVHVRAGVGVRAQCGRTEARLIPYDAVFVARGDATNMVEVNEKSFLASMNVSK